ncbi:unnamed protein product [Microthlaspi erraticum]|uniref:Arabidopsis retrotransposon Orf1 C-terminal domain-containing protein n=1 Tax=Microthlaspi erraticum TaxID=1685480 RepID=A0A6D2JXN9_9BRAS|nr:unnamed protein product [Microthlaspi erraticum]
MLLPNSELTTVSRGSRGKNIEFFPPLHALVGHEDDMREEEPELDRAEDRAADRVQVNEELGEPDCYYFEEYEAPRMNPYVVAAHKRIGLNKWQGKAMKKMKKSMDKMVRKIKSLEKKVAGSSSKKNKSSLTSPFIRSRSLLTTPRRLPSQDPPSASSFELIEARTSTQKRRKSSRARRSNSTSVLDRLQTEEIPLGRADGRVDLEEPEFENPGLEYDPAPYEDYHQSSWNPYYQFEMARFHQGQGSHTHFDDEEEEPQARSSCSEIFPWNAPDGRLPSPPQDLASQFFGEH